MIWQITGQLIPRESSSIPACYRDGLALTARKQRETGVWKLGTKFEGKQRSRLSSR
jgi:hypothetical protein